MFKELIKERDTAYKEWKEASAKVDPYYEAYDKAEESLKDKFIEEKLYIPIKKLKDYLGNRDAESFTIVYKNRKTEKLFLKYGIGFGWTWKNSKHTNNYNVIISGTDDDRYHFNYDIDEQHIIGFYDLTYKSGEKVKETFMEEIIKNLD